MRSEKIYRALSHGFNRYEVCQLVSKGVRAMHKSGSRYEETINDVLDFLSTSSRENKAGDAERGLPNV